MKIAMLSVMYGMGAGTMGKSMGLSKEECKEVLENFYEKFPNIRKFSLENEKLAKEVGYVEDYMGRRRHLPDAQLQEIEVRQDKSVPTNCGVFMDTTEEDMHVDIPDYETTAKWTELWKQYESSGKFNAKRDFKALAEDSGIKLFDNGAYISKTLTQCTNARIQGSAATLTKKAMVSIFNDEEINRLGFKILIPVHDELLGECPAENAERVSKRLSELMINAAKPEISIKFKCDPYITKHWYTDEVMNSIHNDYEKYVKGNEKKGIKPISREEAINTLCDEYEELSREVVIEMCDDTFDILQDRT